MNVVDLVEAARPEVDPMPLAERRMVRERLFGAADDVVKTTIRERSGTGAVTSTAPPGYRANRQSARPRRPNRNGSFAKMGAGLLVVGAALAAGWSWWADSSDDGDESSLVSDTAVSTTTTSTTAPAPTTTLPPTRTGVTPDQPVLFPLGLIPIEEAVVDVAAVDDEFSLMRAGDGTWIRLDAVDGPIQDPAGFDFTRIGSVDVAAFAFAPEAPWIYTLRAPCGAVRVVDAPAQEQFRPIMSELFEGMSIDEGGVVDALLPAGIRIVESSSGAEEYRAVFQFGDEGSEDAEGDQGGDVEFVTLRQVPGGSLAQLLPGGEQPSEMVWLGEPALGTGDLDVSDDVAAPVAVYWRDESTVFQISSDTVPLDRLETFVSGLRAASTQDWVERFSAARVDSTTSFVQQDESAAGTCSPQPTLGPTFLP